jgi:hypothetical protein
MKPTTLRRSLLLVLSTAALILVIGCALSLAKEASAPAPPPVFYKEVPEALEEEIAVMTARISAESPLTAEERERALEILAARDPDDEEAVRPLIEFFRSLDVRAIPLLAEQLIVQDDRARRAALEGLHSLFRLPARRDDSYPRTEAALLALAERSLLDRSVAARRSAVATSNCVALYARPESGNRARAIRAIWSALEDPDPEVRRAAKSYLIWLGEMERPESWGAPLHVH